MSITVCTLHPALIKWDGETRSIHGDNEKYIQNFGWKTWTDHLADWRI